MNLRRYDWEIQLIRVEKSCKVEPTTLTKGAAWEATQEPPDLISYPISLILHVHYLCDFVPYIRDNVRFKCGGEDFGFWVLIRFRISVFFFLKI